MTTAGEWRTPTALDLLFGSGADAAEALAGEILPPGGGRNLGRALAHLPETIRRAAAQEAATTAAALLNIDLIGALVRGWRKHRDIVSAAQRTLAAPASTELVSMPAHEVALDQRPSVSVLLDGQRVATLHLVLSVVFHVNALLLLISGGRLVTVHSGCCEIIATLAVEDADLLVRRTDLDLPGVIPLRRGIMLLPVNEYPASEYPRGEYPTSEYPPGEYPASDPRHIERTRA